ncbi:MAG: argininosuccinate lyase [Roseibium sp.]
MSGDRNDTSQFPDPVYKDTVLSSLFDGVKKHYAAHMATINKAHLVMLGETGILQPEQVSSLAAALVEIDTDVDVSKLEYTGEYEDYFFYVEATLRRKLGDLGGMLHTARSRNDMDHTLFKLALRGRVDVLWTDTAALAEALLEKAEVEAGTLIVAYTHGQPAQPTTFGHYLCAALEVLLRDMKRLSAAADDLEHCPMGAAAITTTGFPIDRDRMADLLGFEAPLLNSYGCIAAVDYITGFYSALKLIYVHLGRLVQDLAFWSSFEVGQLYVPNAFVQISSIMPQKRNPVPIEHMRHLASATAGRCDMMVDIMRNTPFTDMNDSEGEVQQAGYAAFESGSRMLRLLTAFIPACQIDGDRVRRNTDAACITITELADTLVREERLSFRQAHEIAGGTASGVLADDVPLGSGFNHFVAAFELETGNAPRMAAAEFEKTVAPENFIACRTRPGGPAPAAISQALKLYRAQLDGLNAEQDQRRSRHAHSADKLKAAFTAILET